MFSLADAGAPSSAALVPYGKRSAYPMYRQMRNFAGRPRYRGYGRRRFGGYRGYRNRGRMLRINTKKSFPEVKVLTEISATDQEPVASDDPFIATMTTELPQGVLGTARLGVQVTPKTISIKAVFTAAEPVSIAWYVVEWRLSQLMTPFSGGGFLGSPDDITSHSAYADRPNYKILKSGQMSLVPRSGGAQSDKAYLRCSIKPQRDLFWQSGDSASATKNHIFFYAFSDLDAASTPPTINFNSRLYFTDA